MNISRILVDEEEIRDEGVEGCQCVTIGLPGAIVVILAREVGFKAKEGYLIKEEKILVVAEVLKKEKSCWCERC